jgi:GNAT superfamily N-acetyltransferase
MADPDPDQDILDFYNQRKGSPSPGGSPAATMTPDPDQDILDFYNKSHSPTPTATASPSHSGTPYTDKAVQDQSTTLSQQGKPGAIAAIGGAAVRGFLPGRAMLAAYPWGSIAGAAAVGAARGALVGAAVPVAGETGISEAIGGVFGGLIAGAAAAWGVSKLQTAAADVISPGGAFSSKTEQAQTEAHPYASIVGGGLSFGKPNPMNVVRAGKTLASAEGRAALVAFTKTGGKGMAPQAVDEIGNVINVSMAGGLNSAFNVKDQIESGKFDPTQLAVAAATGLIFSEPWFHKPNPAAAAAAKTLASGGAPPAAGPAAPAGPAPPSPPVAPGMVPPPTPVIPGLLPFETNPPIHPASEIARAPAAPLPEAPIPKPGTEGGITNATQEGPVAESSVEQHPGVSSGQNVPENVTDKGPVGSEPAGNRGRAGEAATEPVAESPYYIKEDALGFGVIDREANKIVSVKATEEEARAKMAELEAARQPAEPVIEHDSGLKSEYSTENASVKVSKNGYIRDLFVKPEARRQGEGTALMEQVFADADKSGIPLTLHVGEQRTDLPGFYEKLGFRVDGKDQFGTRYVRDPVKEPTTPETPFSIKEDHGVYKVVDSRKPDALTIPFSTEEAAQKRKAALDKTFLAQVAKATAEKGSDETAKELLKMQREYEASLLEEAQGHQAKGGDELLDVVSEHGVPLNDPNYSGELRNLKEHFAPKNKYGQEKHRPLASGSGEKLYFGEVFKAKAQGNMDSLTQLLKNRGFDVETPDDAINLIDERLRSGNKVYGDEGRAHELERQSFGDYQEPMRAAPGGGEAKGGLTQDEFSRMVQLQTKLSKKIMGIGDIGKDELSELYRLKDKQEGVIEGDFVKQSDDEKWSPQKSWLPGRKKSPDQLDKDIAIAAKKEEDLSLPKSEPGTDIVGTSQDAEQVDRLIGEKAYSNSIVNVIIKELLQNGFDAVREGGVSKAKPGQISIDYDYDTRTITVRDDGVGMSPETIVTAFLRTGGTKKSGDHQNTSGGLGVAKLAFIKGSKRIKLVTVKDGLKTVMDVSREQVKANQIPLVKTYTNEPNGSTVTVEIPKDYINSKGETIPVHFDTDPEFLKNPLFGDVEVKVNGVPNHMGIHSTGWVKDNVFNFDWGHANVYVDPSPLKKYTYTEGTYPPVYRVMSAGLHQFEVPWQHIFDKAEQRIPHNMVIDVRPHVDTKDPQYPFDNQREGWRGSVKADATAMYSYLKRQGLEQDLKKSQEQFKELQVMTHIPIEDMGKTFTADQLYQGDATQGAAGRVTLPKIQSVDVKRDKVVTTYAGGKKEVQSHEQFNKPSFSAEREIDFEKTKLDTSHLDPKNPLYHNNTNVDFEKIKGAPELHAKLGSMLIQFMRAFGAKFGADPTARPEYAQLTNTTPGKAWLGGISYDAKYAGYNITNPFRSLWANPAGISDGGMSSPRRAAFEMLHIFLHEITHVPERNEGGGFTREEINNIGRMADFPEQQKFLQTMEQVLSQHWDTLHEIRDKYFAKSTANRSEGFKTGSQLEPESKGGKGTDKGVPSEHAQEAVSDKDPGQTGPGRAGETNPKSGQLGTILEAAKSGEKSGAEPAHPEVAATPPEPQGRSAAAPVSEGVGGRGGLAEPLSHPSGEPITFYHGQGQRGLGTGDLKPPVYFTPDKEFARGYEEQNGIFREPSEHSLHLKNPKVIQITEEQVRSGAHEMGASESSYINQARMRQYQKQGYDGVISKLPDGKIYEAAVFDQGAIRRNKWSEQQVSAELERQFQYHRGSPKYDQERHRTDYENLVKESGWTKNEISALSDKEFDQGVKAVRGDTAGVSGIKDTLAGIKEAAAQPPETPEQREFAPRPVETGDYEPRPPTANEAAGPGLRDLSDQQMSQVISNSLQKFHDEGITESVDSSGGMSHNDIIDAGREAIRHGVDPEAVAASRAIPSEQKYTVVKAHAEDLREVSEHAENLAKTHPTQANKDAADKAFADYSNWDTKTVKPIRDAVDAEHPGMPPEEYNPRSMTDLRQQMIRQNGHDFTTAQRKDAEQLLKQIHKTVEARNKELMKRDAQLAKESPELVKEIKNGDDLFKYIAEMVICP